MWNMIHTQGGSIYDPTKPREFAQRPEGEIRVVVKILKGDVQVMVKMTGQPDPEDKRMADFIEQKIKEGFEKYHTDKKDKSIDI